VFVLIRPLAASAGPNSHIPPLAAPSSTQSSGWAFWLVRFWVCQVALLGSVPNCATGNSLATLFHTYFAVTFGNFSTNFSGWCLRQNDPILSFYLYSERSTSLKATTGYNRLLHHPRNCLLKPKFLPLSEYPEITSDALKIHCRLQ